MPEDPLPNIVGCFDPSRSYPLDRLVLTYPVPCSAKDGNTTGLPAR